MERSIREANDLMEVSREQLEVMRRQADQALEQAERMNELLGRVVKLTEPLERAQRGGEFVAEGLKRAIFGAEQAAAHARRPPRRRRRPSSGGVEEAAADAGGRRSGAVSSSRRRPLRPLPASAPDPQHARVELLALRALQDGP